MSVLAITGSPSRFPSRSSALLDPVALRLLGEGIKVKRVPDLENPATGLIEVCRDGVARVAFRNALTMNRWFGARCKR